MKRKIKENSGITLITLVITIIVLLILAGVATYSGIEAIENTKYTKFVSELKIMQTYVNDWYEEFNNADEGFETAMQNKFESVNANKATGDEKAQIALEKTGDKDNIDNFYILEDKQKEALGVEGVSQSVMVNIKDRKVVSYLGLKYKDEMYYTLYDLQNGYYNVGYEDKNKGKPEISVTDVTALYNDSYKVSVEIKEYRREICK